MSRDQMLREGLHKLYIKQHLETHIKTVEWYLEGLYDDAIGEGDSPEFDDIVKKCRESWEQLKDWLRKGVSEDE